MDYSKSIKTYILGYVKMYETAYNLVKNITSYMQSRILYLYQKWNNTEQQI